MKDIFLLLLNGVKMKKLKTSLESMLTRSIQVLLTLGLAFLMSACASSVPLESPELDAQMKKFQKPEDGITLYVVQSGGVLTQHRINFQIFVDAKLAAIMSGGTYAVHGLPAGSHTILVMSPENQDVIEISGRNGELVFVGVGSHGGWSQMRVSDLRVLSEDEGKKVVLASKLSRSLGKY